MLRMLASGTVWRGIEDTGPNDWGSVGARSGNAPHGLPCTLVSADIIIFGAQVSADAR